MQMYDIPEMKINKQKKAQYHIFSTRLIRHLIDDGVGATYELYMGEDALDLSRYALIFFPVYLNDHYSLLVVVNNDHVNNLNYERTKLDVNKPHPL